MWWDQLAELVRKRVGLCYQLEVLQLGEEALGIPLPAAVLGGCISRWCCCPAGTLCADASPRGTRMTLAPVHPCSGSRLQKGLCVRALAKGSLVPLCPL